MNSKELAEKIINIDPNTMQKILNDIPIGVMSAANEIVNTVLIDSCWQDASQEETLMYIFWAGYTTAKQENRIVLEEAFKKE